MNYITFHRQFGPLGLFSTHNVAKQYPRFDARRLVEWQQKGYLRRVVNRWYLFDDTPLDENLLWWTANRVYQPSYLSMETALSFYGLIPEGVYSLTSVSSKKNRVLHTPVGTFSYRHLKPAAFFGYQVLRSAGVVAGSAADRPVLMAYPEKAILDYCYLNTHLTTVEDFAATRLNAAHLRAQLDQNRMRDYLNLLNVRRLTQRIAVLNQYIDQYA